MPELPDITVYIEALTARLLGQTVEKIDIRNPFVLRSVTPPIAAAQAQTVRGVERLGKRIVIVLTGELYLIIHLMIAGRLRWGAPGSKPPGGKLTLAALYFANGALFLTEAGTKRRASIHLVMGDSALRTFDRGGLEVLEASPEEFVRRLRSENHTVKRALTDPRLFSGIGNAYSDEILHRAGLSPMALTHRLSDEECTRLHDAARAVLTEWIARLRRKTAGEFPENVTAFHPEMSVHGRFGLPCPVCGSPVQRIRYADNETNYCARCQTGGKLLADRALSRLLKSDWPRSIDELDQ